MLIGISKDDDALMALKDFPDIETLILGEHARDKTVEDIISEPHAFSEDDAVSWYGKKFVIMHNLQNDEIKEILSVFKKFKRWDIIFATTTETSLKWRLEDLLNELVKEDEYFRKGNRDR